MAESVELRTESTLRELEELEKHQIFEKHDIKQISKRRQEFEYHLHRQTKSKDDCLRYIQYEINLLKIIRAKKQKNGIAQKRLYCEFSISNRLNKLFNEAIRKYQDDVRIWLSYVKFCKSVKFYTSASRVFSQLLQLHGKRKPKLYKLAANWELEECKCIEKARKFLLNGLHIHKDSRMLYTEAFKLELRYTNEQRNEAIQKDVLIPEDPVFQGRHALIIYDSASKKIAEAAFLVELLDLACQYDYTVTLQKRILDDLKKYYPNDEITWDAIAKYELNGVLNKKFSYTERIKNCVVIYKKCTEKLKSEKMWSMYIDTLLELQKDAGVGTGNLNDFKRDLLLGALYSGHGARKLREKYYLIWFDLAKSKAEDLTEVLKQATERLNKSLPLWETRIRYHLSRGEITLAETAFRKANEMLDVSALSLWKLLLLYYQARNTAKATALYEEGIKHPCPGIANPLRVMYVERLAITRCIQFARRTYESLIKGPHTLDLHLKMIAMEDFQPEMNLKRIRYCYTMAFKHFGHNNIDLWMDFVRFEKRFGSPESVPNIYNKAVGMLKDKALVDSFDSEFSLLEAGPSN